ncbi:MAG: vWA domain-containing protein [Planctomycetales bacterium]
MKRSVRLVAWLSFALGGSLAIAAEEAGKPIPEVGTGKEGKPAVEVVFVLDTTGSMSGLIQAAQEKIWAIANTLATAKPAPTIKMGLVGYRDRGDAYVTKVTDLTDDLDAVHKELMGFRAEGGGDGPESVNQALHEALTKIKWSADDKTYRVIFLVGDAPPHTDYKDDVQYPASCEQAAKQSIVINTIQCGSQTDTTPVWTKIAQLAEGKYFRVEQSGGAVLAATPFDEKLAKLDGELSATRVYYGAERERRALADKLDAADAEADAAPATAKAGRAEFRAKESGKAAFGGGLGGLGGGGVGAAELVQDFADGRVNPADLDKLAGEKKLPEALLKMTEAERKEYLEQQAARRDEIRKQIEQVSQQRQDYIKQEIEKKSGGKKDSLDQAIFDAVRAQAAPRGLKYEGGPKY